MKTEKMDNLLDAVVNARGYERRSEAYPFVIGLITNYISDEEYDRLIKMMEAQ